MVDQSAQIKYVTAYDHNEQANDFTYFDRSLSKAQKEELKQEYMETKAKLLNSTLYNGFQDVTDGPSGTWHSVYVESAGVIFTRKPKRLVYRFSDERQRQYEN